MGRADDDEHIRLFSFLQLLIGPGIDRPCLFEIIGRGDQPFDRLALIGRRLEIRPFLRRKKSIDLFFQLSPSAS